VAEDAPSRGDDVDERLRAAMSDAAPDAPAVGVRDAVERRVARRRRRVREAVAAGLVVVAGAGVAIGLELDPGPRGTIAGPAATSTTLTSTTSPQRATAAQAQGMGAGLSDGGEAPPTPPPCKADQRTPSSATGSYCGPAPHAGNGSGPNGTCTGSETVPPCGPGAVPGRYYAYTEPGTCSGLIVFDGKRWVSELPPPVPGPDSYGWISLGTNGTLRWNSPNGSVGFQPYAGQALKVCG
jgi:hypothetical protein